MVKGIKKIKYNMRTVVQALFTVLTNGYLKGFVTGGIYQGSTKAICVPGLNCYSCPGALGACPIGALQAVLGSPWHKFSFYVVGFLVAFGASFGRFICGWLCPFGFFQDLLYKLPFHKKVKNLPGHKYLKFLRYIVLLVFVILMPLLLVDVIGQGSPWFCKLICPSGTLSGGWTLPILNPELRSALGGLFTWKSLILVVIIFLSILSYRPFCKYLCPLGAIYGVFNPIALYRYSVDNNKCSRCGHCKNVCPVEINVYQTPNSFDCIRCGKCKGACPEKAIISSIERKKCKLANQSQSDKSLIES